MQQKYLYQVLPFLSEFEEKKRQKIEKYFHTAPVWLMDSFKIEYMEKGHIFIQENAPVDMVYVIVEGIIKATDYRMVNGVYDYMKFDEIYAMGGMEVIMDLAFYKTTIETVTPCTVIIIPIDKFRKWLETDIHALKQEAKSVATYLNKEARQDRAFLFLQGDERLMVLLTQRYESYNVNGTYESMSTRTELAEETGICVRTINRAVKKLEDEGMLDRKGNRLSITQEQYQKMKQSVSNVLA